MLYGVLRTLNVAWLNAILRIYLELFRAIPVLVWLYLLFFGLPIFFGLSLPSFWCAVLVLSLCGALIALFSAAIPDRLRSDALAVQGLIGAAFLLFILLTSNPFARVSPAP